MGKTLQIDFFSRKWPPAMGGMETYSHELVKALAPHAEVRAVTLPGNPDGSVPKTGALMWFGLRAGLTVLFSRRPAPVIHIADMAIWPFAFLARLRKPSTKMVVSAHGTDVAFPLRGGLRGRLYGMYLALGARLLKSATIIANSSATAAQVRRFGYQHVVVIPLAAEVEVSGESSTSPRTVLFSGRLIASKGCRWFIEQVLPLLPEDISLDVAGTVWDEDERAALAAPRVRYLGRLEQEELWRCQRDALCVVIPNLAQDASQFEGFGLVAVEAAAAGGVVVAARHGGIVDAVQDNETGFIIAPGEASEWASKIKEIAAWSASERSAFTTRATAICARHYSWTRVAQDTIAHYQNVDDPA
ncbi:hypothetical protein RA27_15235 [Ruegeria sp. ANG-R]|uniref:glycosyltransferase family 4 protein n=1 Tax=Ruegeria sp. ANG-R TaxID=1577903 RepID=UPI0005802F6A|nr:glycosyltransferase family 4 protein [Ruegeria sp. ANG-R]KIC40180.1 hypothetical protein RA27_15235 [Ruegeria sp. ANG-R]